MNTPTTLTQTKTMTLAVAWNKTSMSYNVNNNFGPNVVCYTRKTVQGVSEINARGGAIG